ncbi:MAG: hypothetical protein ACRDZX_11550 [Acidimicrobiales bacterium]
MGIGSFARRELPGARRRLPETSAMCQRAERRVEHQEVEVQG